MADTNQIVNNDPNSQGQPSNQDPQGGVNGNQNPNGASEVSIPKHRFDEVNKNYQELKAWKEQQEKIEKEKQEAELIKKGEFESLLKKEKEEKENLLRSFETQKKTDAIKLEAIKRGARNPDVVVKLIDLESVKLLEDKSIDASSLGNVFAKLTETDSYLFGESKPSIGGDGGNPDGSSNNVKMFKRSQLKDSTFYRENEADILKAMKTGNIIDDL